MGNRSISGKTKLCGIIGDPIEHTMSPVMHNAAFEKVGLDYCYVPFRVKKEDLGKAIEGRSGDILSLGKGTLYPLLYNLEAKKLIKGKWETSESARKRRYYSITGKGKAQLAKQKEQLKELTLGLNFVFGGSILPA